jgi:hypothetical protein
LNQSLSDSAATQKAQIARQAARGLKKIVVAANAGAQRFPGAGAAASTKA